MILSEYILKVQGLLFKVFVAGERGREREREGGGGSEERRGGVRVEFVSPADHKDDTTHGLDAAATVLT